MKFWVDYRSAKLIEADSAERAEEIFFDTLAPNEYYTEIYSVQEAD